MSPSAVTEVVRALGSWDLTLTDRTPQHIVDALLDGRFGHIAIDAARDNPEVLGDELLGTCRFVGVIRSAGHEAGQVSLGGSGMAFWLGAEDGLGDVFEDAVAFADAAFEDVVEGLLPPAGAVTLGTVTAPDGYTPYTGTHRYQTSRQALDYFCDLAGADWRVNGDGTLDAGPPDVLFVGDPQTAVIRRESGYDMGLRALPGSSRLDSDVEDFSTRVVTLAEGEGSQIAVGTADIAVNPYVDLNGNPIKLTRLVSESNTSATNADARAALALAQYTTPREQVRLSTETHDIRGNLAVGDSVWVYDPDAGLVDHDNEIVFRGDRISPVRLRVFQVSWPVEAGMGVYFRTPAGEWIDLTDYVAFEDGAINLTVGGYDRPLVNQAESVSFRPNLTNPEADNSVPGVPAFVTPFAERIYTGTTGLSRGQVTIGWTGPATNTDGSAFVDGAHFEIRYRIPAAVAADWSQAAAHTWGELAQWATPVPQAGTDWQSVYAPPDVDRFLIQELTPGITYEFQIRAVDAANPPHAGDWSASHLHTLGDDIIPPPAPAAPVVAGSLVQISVRHNLGVATGGTFNLPPDMAYLEVHIGGSESFTPTADTRVGKIVATRTQVNGKIPVIGAFPVATPDEVWVKVIAVDLAGNRSDPSAAAAVTAELIDSQWVSNLTADVITFGSFTGSYGLIGLLTAGDPDGARFTAGDDGERVGMMLHRPSGTLALHGDANTGNLSLYGPDGLTETLKFTASDGLIDMRGRLTAGAGIGSGPTVLIDPASPPAIKMYPTGAQDRFELIATTTARPGGVPAAGFELRGLNSSGQTNGLSLEAWSTNVWLAQKRTDGSQIGGAVKLQQTGEAFLTNEDDSVRVDVRTDSVVLVAGVGAFGLTDTGEFSALGTWATDENGGGTSALYVGETFVAAGFDAISMTYSATMASILCPIVTVDGTLCEWVVGNNSTTGFVVAWTGTDQHWIRYWCFRI